MRSIGPFVKWPGGKSSLISELTKHTPNNFKSYHELFVGGGALFLSLNAKKSNINDINKGLIDIYLTIKNKPLNLLNKLQELKDVYLQGKMSSKKAIYYKSRKMFNYQKLDKISRSAYFIFLNKTCFNGIYRENSRGYFNVPFGNHESPEIFNKDNILGISEALQDTTITKMPYENALKKVRKGDFVYLDPPYFSDSARGNFTKYHKSRFLKDDHFKLKREVDKLDKKGVFFLLSNSDNHMIKNLFMQYKIITVNVNRTISCKSGSRGIVSELLIKNY